MGKIAPVTSNSPELYTSICHKPTCQIQMGEKSQHKSCMAPTYLKEKLLYEHCLQEVTCAAKS